MAGGASSFFFFSSILGDITLLKSLNVGLGEFNLGNIGGKHMDMSSNCLVKLNFGAPAPPFAVQFVNEMSVGGTGVVFFPFLPE